MNPALFLSSLACGGVIGRGAFIAFDLRNPKVGMPAIVVGIVLLICCIPIFR